MRNTNIFLLIGLMISSSLFSSAQLKKEEMVSIQNLYDAFGKERKGLVQDFGFSCIVQYKGKTILFDAGTNTRTFEQNLKALKIKPKTIDIAILSHGHYDHMGGFDYLIRINPKMKIYLPYDFFSLGAPTKFPFKDAEPEAAKTLSKDEQYFRGEAVTDGMVTVPTGRFSTADVEYLKDYKEVLPGVTIIATTSTLMGTFIKYPPFDKEPQFRGLPELSLSLATAQGQILISGCSHTTIEAIIQETKKVRTEDIRLVTGGFHLIPYDREYIQSLATRMKDQYGVKGVAPAHCTGHLGFSVFQTTFGNQYTFFGLGEKIVL